MRKLRLNKKNLTIALVVIVLVAMGSFIFIRPIIVGYSTYQSLASSNLTTKDYLAELSQIQVDLEKAEKMNTEASEQSNTYSTEIQKLQILVLSLNETMSRSDKKYQDDLKEMQRDVDVQLGITNSKLDKCETRLKNLDNDYDDLVDNVAENICCKMKVDDSNIDSYDVNHDKIVCSDDGKYNLDCPF